jgi:CheY-like chemotaxis protein
MAEVREKKSVLFVDDHPPIAVMGHRMLTRLGYEATHCTSSLEALDHFQKAPERFDLVITDLNMPRMDGEALARHFWDIRPDVPIILCTGIEVMGEDKARLLGFEGLLTKPFGLEELFLIVEQALAPRMLPKAY